MGNYEQDADAVLEKKGHTPKRPLALLLMGSSAEKIYDLVYKPIDGMTIADSQRVAIDEAWKRLRISKHDEWRDQYKKDGYVQLYSPLLEECIYLCRDERSFKKLNNEQDLVVYMEKELPRLRNLLPEELQWLHEGKKFKGKIL